MRLPIARCCWVGSGGSGIGSCHNSMILKFLAIDNLMPQFNGYILKENLSALGKGDNLVALENRNVVFSWSSGFGYAKWCLRKWMDFEQINTCFVGSFPACA